MIVVFVEGPSDAETIPILLRKTGQSLKVKPKRRGWLTESVKVIRYIKALQEIPEKVVVLLDSHCSDPIEVKKIVRKNEKEVAKELSIPVKYGVVIHALEAWLLSDTLALEKVVGGIIRSIAEPEKDCKPDEIMKDIFRKNNGQYSKTFHAPKIAHQSDPNEISKKCNSFREFVKLVEDP